MSAHALFSPSGAHRWMACPASLALEADCPNESSAFADEGTAAHELAQMCLTENLDADAYIGRVIVVGNREFVVDEDMAAYVQVYVDAVRSYADGGELFVEQRVDFGEAIGQPGDGFGTADAIVIQGNELQLHDLKYGRGVKVDAEENDQLLLYAVGALEQLGIAYEFERVRLVIHQPRLDALSEWDCDVARVQEQARVAFLSSTNARNAIITASKGEPIGDGFFGPEEKACRFCKAKASCPALQQHVTQQVVGDFEDLTVESVASATADLDKVFSKSLGQRMAVVGLVEDWCKAVRARAESELLAGRRVDGFKLVEGRRGARSWASDEAAEATLKAMRLKLEQMYDFKLISPTTAEKLKKSGAIGPRQWPKVETLITQSPGKPSVAPESDKRPALDVTDSFSDLTKELA
jgi:hypothetical protein